MTNRSFYIIALGASLGVAVFLSPFASEAPDGLGRVAANLGFFDRAAAGPLEGAAPMPDYAAPGLPGTVSGMAGATRLLGGRRNRKE